MYFNTDAYKKAFPRQEVKPAAAPELAAEKYDEEEVEAIPEADSITAVPEDGEETDDALEGTDDAEASEEPEV